MKYDGTSWANVGTAGFSVGEVDFTSLAFNPTDGQPYVAYQDWANSLKATVMKYDYSTGINDLQQSQLSIYPNPAEDIITVEISDITKENRFSILNLNGQPLFTHQITQPKTQLDISSLPNGVFFVKVTGERTVEVKKMIKQ